jgi:hypothetical protein
MRKVRTRKLAVEQISKKLKDLMISSRVLDELAEGDTVFNIFSTNKRIIDSFLVYLSFRARSIIKSAMDGEITVPDKDLKEITLLNNVLKILLFSWGPAVYINHNNYDRFIKPDERTSDAYMMNLDLRCRKAMNLLHLLFERGLSKWYLAV